MIQTCRLLLLLLLRCHTSVRWRLHFSDNQIVKEKTTTTTTTTTHVGAFSPPCLARASSSSSCSSNPSSTHLLRLQRSRCRREASRRFFAAARSATDSAGLLVRGVRVNACHCAADAHSPPPDDRAFTWRATRNSGRPPARLRTEVQAHLCSCARVAVENQPKYQLHQNKKCSTSGIWFQNKTQ